MIKVRRVDLYPIFLHVELMLPILYNEFDWYVYSARAFDLFMCVRFWDLFSEIALQNRFEFV